MKRIMTPTEEALKQISSYKSDIIKQGATQIAVGELMEIFDSIEEILLK